MPPSITSHKDWRKVRTFPCSDWGWKGAGSPFLLKSRGASRDHKHTGYSQGPSRSCNAKGYTLAPSSKIRQKETEPGEGSHFLKTARCSRRQRGVTVSTHGGERVTVSTHSREGVTVSTHGRESNSLYTRQRGGNS